MAADTDAATTARPVIGEVKLEVDTPFMGECDVYVEASDSPHRALVIGDTDKDAAPSGKIGSQPQPIEAGSHAERAMFLDIDAILARVEQGVSMEQIRMDALLARLSRQGKR